MIGARASEQLRQEREAFDQAKAHDARWFTLRLMIGYARDRLAARDRLDFGLHPAPAGGAIPLPRSRLRRRPYWWTYLGLVVTTFKFVLQQSSAVPLKPATGNPLG